jgi:hypothetical protein
MRKGPSRRIGRSGNAMPLICNTRSFDAADVPSQWAQLIRWLFVFNSRFARINQAHRSATPSCQRFDHPPPGEAHQRGRNFEAQLSALEKECEVQSAAGSL